MQAYLMNFGDNTRIFNNSDNMPVSIGIGELKECDIHDVHFHMIRRAVSTESLMVVPKDVRQSDRLIAIMELLKQIETAPMEECQRAFFDICPHVEGELVNLRPMRHEMRAKLRDAARVEVATALRLQSRVFIREEQPNTLPRNPPPRTDNRSDGALNIDVPETRITPEARESDADVKTIKAPEATTAPPKPKKAMGAKKAARDVSKKAKAANVSAKAKKKPAKGIARERL